MIGKLSIDLLQSRAIDAKTTMNGTDNSLEDYSPFIGAMYQVYTVLAPLIFVIVIITLLLYVALLTLK